MSLAQHKRWYPMPHGMTPSSIRGLIRVSGQAARLMEDGWLTELQADQVACAVGSHIDVMWPDVALIDRVVASRAARPTRLAAWVHRWHRTHPAEP